MKFGKHASALRNIVKVLGLSLALVAVPQAVQAAAPQAAQPAAREAPQVDPGTDASIRADVPAVEQMANKAAGGEAGGDPQATAPQQRMAPVIGKGMPVPGAITLQEQYSPLGEYGHWIHNVVLMPLIAVISLFVLFLLVWVVVRYNRRANPVASRTSHNTIIEVVWTLVPVLILVGIAVPSIDLLAKQFKPAPEHALTIKVTGNQWYWTYSYPDNGEFELVSNMLNIPGYPVINNGVREVGSDPSDGPAQLEVDNRLVVPVGEQIRMQITAADVIHSFAVPSLWFKLDAVPGRINEKVLQIDKPGVYYGQCSELCGPKHAFMPIAIEALPRDQFNAWVLSQPGGKIDGQKEPAAALPAPAAQPSQPAGAAEAAPAGAVAPSAAPSTADAA